MGKPRYVKRDKKIGSKVERRWISRTCLVIIFRAASFLVLKPILTRIGIGARVFTWPHTFVMIWGGFKGAVTLALGMLGAKDPYFDNYLEIRSKLLFHSAGVVAFTLLFNATTMRFFLKRLGKCNLRTKHGFAIVKIDDSARRAVGNLRLPLHGRFTWVTFRWLKGHV